MEDAPTCIAWSLRRRQQLGYTHNDDPTLSMCACALCTVRLGAGAEFQRDHVVPIQPGNLWINISAIRPGGMSEYSLGFEVVFTMASLRAPYFNHFPAHWHNVSRTTVK